MPSRIPKLRRWRCTHKQTGKTVEVAAPTRLLAKMNATYALDIPIQWYAEFSATPIKNVASTLKLS